MVPALRTPGWPIAPEGVPVRRTSSDFFAANLHARLAGSSATVRTPNTGARPIRRSSTSRAPSTRERSPSARELHQRINAVRRPNVPWRQDGRLNHRRGSALAGLKSGADTWSIGCAIAARRLGSRRYPNAAAQCAANTLSTNCRADSLRLKVSARARASSLGIERAASAARPRFASSTPAPLSPITSSGPTTGFAATGRPDASASSSTRPKVSVKLGNTNTSALA